MNNPFLTTGRLRLLYISIWVMISIAQILIEGHYVGGQTSPRLLSDAIVCNVLQAGCLLMLWYPLKYYRNIVNIPLFLLFHILLALISLAIWLGIGYLITQYLILSQDSLYTQTFITILPLRILFGLLTHVIFVLVYYLLLSGSEIKEQKEVIEETEAGSTSAPAEKLARISVKKNKEIRFIPINQILYIEANGDYVLIHTNENKYLKDRTMKYWETHLPDDLFVRIHRSFIVNIEWIAKIELYEKETYKVQLKNGHSIKASNTGYKLLRQKMQL
jgi:hypothetical protein